MKRFVILLLLTPLILQACGEKKIAEATLACQISKKMLRSKIGPEFGKLLQAIAIPIDEQTYGCALRFNRIAEELPGEVVGDLSEQSSDELAIMLKDTQNREILRIISPPRYRSEIVRLSFILRDVHIGQAPELLVLEKAKQSYKSYQALRVFNFAKGVPIARELFSQRLLLKTPEGIQVVPQWKFEQFEERQALVIRGGGEFRVFMWHDGLQKFKLDLAASQRKKMKGSPSQMRSYSNPKGLKKINKKAADDSKSTPTDPQSSQKTSVKDLLNTL